MTDYCPEYEDYENHLRRLHRAERKGLMHLHEDGYFPCNDPVMYYCLAVLDLQGKRRSTHPASLHLPESVPSLGMDRQWEISC